MADVVSGGGAHAELCALEDLVGHRFSDPGLLATALAHASHAHEVGEGRGNERLEFLGDAVLDLVVAETLYEAHPDWPEGDLTRARAALVNRDALAARARLLDLGRFVKLGRTEQLSGGADKASILANCFEALVGALYLDAGLGPVATLVKRLFPEAMTRAAARDPKTEFQEWAHAERRTTPSYRTTGDSGVEDDDARFTVEVSLEGEVWGAGTGRSKRAAERSAALRALERVAGAGRRGG